MPGNNSQHGAPIFKPLVGLARTAGRGESLLWAGFPGYDARAVLPLGQPGIRYVWKLNPPMMSPHPPHFSSISCIIHRLIDTRLKDDFFVGNNAFVLPLPMEDVMPLFLLKASCGGVNKQQGGASESYNTGRREGGKQSTIGSNFVRILFKILHQSFW